MSLADFLPAFWAMRPEALRKAVSDAASLRSAADLSERQAAAGISSGERRPYRLENGLAVIPVQGSLMKEFHYPPFWTSYVVVRSQLETALADPEVRAVLLDIDSPGGTVAGFQDLADAVFAARGRKPVYAWTDGVACSAAYGIGAGAKLFAASPMAEVGSVGVVWVHSEWTKYDERVGLTVTVLRAGEFKALGNEFEALDAQAREVHQATLDGMYALFREGVVKARGARGLSEKKFEEWAEGRVFLAGDAVKVGLLDHACPKDEYLSLIMKEVNMNEVELRGQWPEAVKAIEEGAAKAATAETVEKVAGAKSGVVALAGVLFGEEAKDKLSAAVEAGLSAEQAAKLGLTAQERSGEDTTQQEMLAALQNTDQPGVKPGASKPAGESPLMAAVTRLSGQGR